jgi:hypothetical protein
MVASWRGVQSRGGWLVMIAVIFWRPVGAAAAWAARGCIGGAYRG